MWSIIKGETLTLSFNGIRLHLRFTDKMVWVALQGYDTYLYFYSYNIWSVKSNGLLLNIISINTLFEFDLKILKQWGILVKDNR